MLFNLLRPNNKKQNDLKYTSFPQHSIQIKFVHFIKPIWFFI